MFNPEKLALTEYKLITGHVETPEDLDFEKIEAHSVLRDLQLGFDIEGKSAKADFTIEIKTDSNKANKKEATGNFHFVYIFTIENLAELAKVNDKNLVEIDPNLGNALSSISYSTSRGILLTRLQGTALQKFILPVINPNKLLKRM